MVQPVIQLQMRPRKTRFPIFRLPLVVQRKILHDLILIDLLELSICSRKSAEMIRNCTLPYDKMDIFYETDEKYISIQRDGKVVFVWRFNSNSEWKPKKFKIINGVRMKALFLISHVYSESHTPELDMQTVIALFTRSFRIPIGKVTLYALHDLNKVIIGMGECEEVEVYTRYVEPLTNSQLNCLVENVKPTSSFRLHLRMEVGSNCDIRLNCDNIMIIDSHWMTRANLLNTRAAFLKLYQCNLTGRDFIEFVKQWMDSDDTKLQCVFSSGNNVLTGFKNHGLPIMPFNETRRARMHCSNHYKYQFDFSNGWDIERKDGLLATIQFNENIFRMVVWHDRFPEPPTETYLYL